MKTILVTGGMNGIGKGVAMHYLKKGDRVIVIGSSSANGNVLYNEAKQLGAEERAVYIQANLSLVKGSGMKGNVNWNDLQHKNTFAAQKVMMHGSRLNDLSGVAFVENDTVGKIKYILYNPWAVQTPGMMEVYSSPMMKLMYKIIGKPAEKATLSIVELLDKPPMSALSAYRERKELNLTLPTYNQENAKKLYTLTAQMLKGF